MNVQQLRRDMVRLKYAHKEYVQVIQQIPSDHDAFAWAARLIASRTVYDSIIFSCSLHNHEVRSILNNAGIEFTTNVPTGTVRQNFAVTSWQYRRAIVRMASGLKKLHRLAEAQYNEAVAAQPREEYEHT